MRSPASTIVMLFYLFMGSVIVAKLVIYLTIINN